MEAVSILKLIVEHLKYEILHQLSCQGTPNRMVLLRWNISTSLTLSFHAHIPTYLWVVAFSTTVFLINRMPTRSTKYESFKKLLD